MNEVLWLVGGVTAFVFACGWVVGWRVGKSPRTVVTRVDIGKWGPFLRLVRRHDAVVARLRERGAKLEESWHVIQGRRRGS